MRINRYIAYHSGMSRRDADKAIQMGRVLVNGKAFSPNFIVGPDDKVTLDGVVLQAQTTPTTIVLNKPVGYVCSRSGQGSKTIYELLPKELHQLKPVGRLDKDSSGLLLLTNDGELAHQLTHPSFQKPKQYTVQLTSTLMSSDAQDISGKGIRLEDGISKLQLIPADDTGKLWYVRMYEGRNRQIRRTFGAKGYKVKDLHRTHFGEFSLGSLAPGEYSQV